MVIFGSLILLGFNAALIAIAVVGVISLLQKIINEFYRKKIS